MKILTVEDDNMIREGISEYLSEFGYTVIQAKDGREALSKFNSDINLVILDIQIPFINGLEVLKETWMLEKSVQSFVTVTSACAALVGIKKMAKATIPINKLTSDDFFS